MFSVIIPLYNKELTIKNTIVSVLEQTYQNFEIIVIDDGSTDSSAKLVQEFRDYRIKLVQQKNQGVSAARNLGIQEAKYDWIALLDGDDLWKPNHLEEIIKMMKKFPDEKVYVTSFKYSDNRRISKYPRNNPIFKIENYFKVVLVETLMWTSTVVIHKSCFNKLGGFNIHLSRGEDLDMWRRLAKKYIIIKSINETAIYNLVDGNSLTKTKSKLENSILSTIQLKGTKSFERKYYKKMIYDRIKHDIRDLDIVDLYKLLSRHKLEIFK